MALVCLATAAADNIYKNIATGPRLPDLGVPLLPHLNGARNRFSLGSRTQISAVLNTCRQQELTVPTFIVSILRHPDFSNHPADDLVAHSNDILGAQFPRHQFPWNCTGGGEAMEKSTDLTHLTSAGPWAGLIFLEHGVKAEDLRCSEELWKKNPLNPAFDASTAPPNGWRGAPERMQICLQNTCRIGLARILVDGIWTRLPNQETDDY
ncbi:hypothetical protein C8R46DRAFT_1027769 [Mycena filopes]|nr:hypothetical protein C8R46DRAFT_1037765 [Mycena filopes]KAJ7181962.1 hypothetical protein C8R46DRAFT_1027769 [Mycena filopes]